MKSDKTTPNVPTLRFAEFTDEWEKYELSHFVTRITRRNKNNKSSLPLTISAQYGLVDQISFFNKTVASVDLSGYYLLYNGDFAYNKSYSNDYAWGAVKRLDKYEKGCLSSLYFVFRPNDNVDSDYLTHYFESSKWHKGISNIAGEGARNHGLLNMSVDDYFATKHCLPSLPEQKKIARFFNAITRRIEIQNKIISKYQTLIKGLCDMIFSSIEGNILPLKAIVSIEKGQQINGMSLAKTGKYYYLNGGIAPSGYIDDYNTSEETISISEGGNSCGFVSYNLQKFWSGGHCYTLKIMAEQCRSKYLFFYLKYKEKDIMQLRVGSGLPNIQKKSLENFNVKLPNYKKQCFVERIFEVVTAKKEIENALLERFQSQKKFLLSKMFI
jgi:type I restriction enzyme S subunit